MTLRRVPNLRFVTLVSALRGDGTARAGSATRSGAALKGARRRKERTYLELAGEGGRAKLVVLEGQVGGRWSCEAASFLTSLAQHKAHGAPVLLKGSVEAAWRRRWAALLKACRVAPGPPVSTRRLWEWAYLAWRPWRGPASHVRPVLSGSKELC